MAAVGSPLQCCAAASIPNGEFVQKRRQEDGETVVGQQKGGEVAWTVEVAGDEKEEFVREGEEEMGGISGVLRN